ncbi:MAG: rRNA maturation RNase YbeY, partial [Candidatus Paceibacterota bacterium]
MPDPNNNFFITNLTKRNVPDIPFVAIKNKVLNKNFNISLVFVTPAKARELNKTYRQKNYYPNVLTFPLAKKDGEIFINLTRAISEACEYKHSNEEHLAFLFIHGLLHLKGLSHSSKMESEEQKFLKLFFTNGKKSHHRLGYRYKLDQTRRLRTKKR